MNSITTKPPNITTPEYQAKDDRNVQRIRLRLFQELHLGATNHIVFSADQVLYAETDLTELSIDQRINYIFTLF